MSELDRRLRAVVGLGEGRALYLLAAILAYMVIAPAIPPGSPLAPVFRYSANFLLLVAAFTVASSERPIPALVFLVAVPLALRQVPPLMGVASVTTAVLRDLYIGFALLYVVWRGLRRMFQTESTTTDTIATALCAYLLIGIAFISLYEAVDAADARSFGDAATLIGEARLDGADDSAGSHASEGARRSGGLFYFSFVTLTTLGYGDITPKTPPARSLAIVEAIIGQMFVAIVLARIVALYRRPRREDDQPDE